MRRSARISIEAGRRRVQRRVAVRGRQHQQHGIARRQRVAGDAGRFDATKRRVFCTAGSWRATSATNAGSRSSAVAILRRRPGSRASADEAVAQQSGRGLASLRQQADQVRDAVRASDRRRRCRPAPPRAGCRRVPAGRATSAFEAGHQFSCGALAARSWEASDSGDRQATKSRIQSHDLRQFAARRSRAVARPRRPAVQKHAVGQRLMRHRSCDLASAARVRRAPDRGRPARAAAPACGPRAARRRSCAPAVPNTSPAGVPAMARGTGSAGGRTRSASLAKSSRTHVGAAGDPQAQARRRRPARARGAARRTRDRDRHA